jgi:murein DD-endopeptidase MepM/ murein hydrolase activator NlpD
MVAKMTDCGQAAVTIAAALLLAGCNFSGRPQPEPSLLSSAPAAAAIEPAAGMRQPGAYSAFPGDTVYGVAQRFGVPVRALIDSNALKPPYRLLPGQQLRVPVREEHVVRAGDSLLAISRIYGLDQSSLARANGIEPPFGLRPGQRLVLPGRVEANVVTPAVPAPAVSAGSNSGASGSMSVEPLPSADPASVAARSGGDSVIPAPPLKPAATQAPQQADPMIAALPDATPPSSGDFQWPVEGKVVSRFGPKKGGLHNDGINIAAAAGTSVVAAADGVVAYAGNELRGFGNLLLIRHAGGWVTAYAHAEELLVEQGDKVKRGQPVARVGSTGSVSSPQLHFEIRKGTDPVDPFEYLAVKRAGLSPGGDPAGRQGPG